MKKLIFRKFAKDTTFFFILICFVVGLIVWTLQAVNYFDFVVQDGHGLKTYFLYIILNFPKIIHRITPFIFFISLFYILIDYETRNELLIYWTSGVSKIGPGLQGIFSDAALVIMTSSQNPNKRIKFTDVYPTNLSPLQFDVTGSDVAYLEADVTFRYRQFDVVNA